MQGEPTPPENGRAKDVRIPEASRWSDIRPLDAMRILADPYSVTILAATQKLERTAVELSYRFGIPIAVAYRRVNDLVAAGVLETAGQALTREAKRIWMYRSRLLKAEVEFDGISLRVMFFSKDGTRRDFGGSWTLREIAGPPTVWEAERIRKGGSVYFPPAARGGLEGDSRGGDRGMG